MSVYGLVGKRPTPELALVRQLDQGPVTENGNSWHGGNLLVLLSGALTSNLGQIQNYEDKQKYRKKFRARFDENSNCNFEFLINNYFKSLFEVFVLK